MAQSASYQKMEVKKEEYHAVSGASYGEEKRAGEVIASQPTAYSGVENYVLDLDATQVAGKNNNLNNVLLGT